LLTYMYITYITTLVHHSWIIGRRGGHRFEGWWPSLYSPRQGGRVDHLTALRTSTAAVRHAAPPPLQSRSPSLLHCRLSANSHTASETIVLSLTKLFASRRCNNGLTTCSLCSNNGSQVSPNTRWSFADRLRGARLGVNVLHMARARWRRCLNIARLPVQLRMGHWLLLLT
jgi:hypothetical protein